MKHFAFLSHSNKRSTRRSRVPPPWFSLTPEGGRWASVSEFTLFRGEKKKVAGAIETGAKLKCLLFFPPGPQTSERAEISEEM